MRLLLAAALCGCAAAAVPHRVAVNLTSPSFTVSKSFVSFTMDAGETGRWYEEKAAFWYNELARALAKPLAPAFFRYGGTGEDYTRYDFPGEAGKFVCPESAGRACPVMNGTVFKGLVDFSKAAGWQLIYGANLISNRDAQNAWDPAPFNSLLRYADDQGYALAGWELGNEPDLKCKAGHVRHVNCTMPQDAAVPPAQVAKDFGAFKALLRGSAVQKDALLLGPDVAGTPSSSFVTPFLEAAAPQLLDVLTWHFYYGPGSSRPHGLPASSFSTPATLDRFLHSASQALSVSHAAQAAGKSKQVWAGETSSTYGGGTANASAGFSAGFMWVDKLGLAANLGHKVVCRQVFAHSRYSVIGDDNLPNPDYWSSVLWRRLVGSHVIAVGGGLAPGRAVRTYAFCAAEDYFSHAQVGAVSQRVHPDTSFVHPSEGPAKSCRAGDAGGSEHGGARGRDLGGGHRDGGVSRRRGGLHTHLLPGCSHEQGRLPERQVQQLPLRLLPEPHPRPCWHRQGAQAGRPGERGAAGHAPCENPERRAGLPAAEIVWLGGVSGRGCRCVHSGGSAEAGRRRHGRPCGGHSHPARAAAAGAARCLEGQRDPLL